jgi:hypothetical protein
MYPTGSAAKVIEDRMNILKEQSGIISEEKTQSAVEELIEEIFTLYKRNAASKA